MSNQNRRNFLKLGALAGSSLFATAAFNMPTGKNNLKSAAYGKFTKHRFLGSGKDKIEVSALGLGCMGMSFNRSFIPDKKPMIALIRKAYDMGVTLFDTAEAYGPFTNETLVGEAIAPFRKNITLCSKFGFDIQNNKMTGGLNSHPAHIREVVEQSLKRLNTDVIDVVYQHRVDPKIPIEDVAGTVKDLIKEGKVKHFGLSELGISFVPYSPLCRAYLTGYINERTKYLASNDNRPTLPRYTPDAIKANWAIIDVLTEFGNQRGFTAAQVALAWLMAQKPWIIPIPGTTKLAHLQENLWSAEIEFTPDELNKLTSDITKIKITGDRYPTPQTK